MIRQELIPLYPNRPAVIKRGPEYFYVSMRDQAFLATMRIFRRLLIQDHPDRGGNLRRFLSVSKKRASFLKREVTWYAAIGLAPPGLVLQEVETGPVKLHGAVRNTSPKKRHRKYVTQEQLDARRQERRNYQREYFQRRMAERRSYHA